VHLLPRVGDYELREITPMVVEDLRGQMTRAKVGARTQRKALMLLEGILRRAVEGSSRKSAGRTEDAPLRPSMIGKAGIPCKYRMDDAGLEPATSALSRRRSPS
jgi:hypothetical protein